MKYQIISSLICFLASFICINCRVAPPLTSAQNDWKEVNLKNNSNFQEIKTNPVDNAELIFVPAGKFSMGAEDGEDSEKPVHTVDLDDFYIYKTEVTNFRFNAFIKATGYQTEAEKTGFGVAWNPDKKKWERVKGANWMHPTGPGANIKDLDDYPVVQVTWNDAKKYCQWAGGDLPGEAQWEKAARGTDGRRYPWGDEIPDARTPYANFADKNFEAWFSETNIDDGYRFIAPAGSYPKGASPYGALDMAGNVSEWVNDWFDPEYYQNSPAANPPGAEKGDGKVTKGGGWNNTSKGIRPAGREWSGVGARTDSLGFRCALKP